MLALDGTVRDGTQRIWAQAEYLRALTLRPGSATKARASSANAAQAAAALKQREIHIGIDLGSISLKVAAIADGPGSEILEEALTLQREKGERLGEILVQQKRINESELMAALAAQLNLEVMTHISDEHLRLELLLQPGPRVAEQLGVVHTWIVRVLGP